MHNHVLNLVHVLEAGADLASAVQVIKGHLQDVADTAVAAGGVISPSEYGDIVSALSDGTAHLSPSSSSLTPVLDPSQRVLWHPIRGGGAHEGYASVERNDEGSGEEGVGSSVDLSNDLDLLALAFTLVKVLFLQGNLAVIPSLVRVIERIRRRSTSPLHTTSIRNEHAYYMCVCQVMAAMQDQDTSLPHSPFNNTFSDAKPLYVVGDSHCLSSAWSVLTLRGEKRLVVPKLVTGVKQWHLRPESDFYTKESFQRTVAGIPARSDVSAQPEGPIML